MSSEEGRSFEDQWQDAFEGAEAEPPAHLWSGIDGALANEEAGMLFKQVRFYRYVAAAAIVFCCSLVIYLMTDYTFSEDIGISHEHTDPNKVAEVVDETSSQDSKNLSSLSLKSNQDDGFLSSKEENLQANESALATKSNAGFNATSGTSEKSNLPDNSLTNSNPVIPSIESEHLVSNSNAVSERGELKASKDMPYSAGDQKGDVASGLVVETNATSYSNHSEMIPEQVNLPEYREDAKTKGILRSNNLYAKNDESSLIAHNHNVAINGVPVYHFEVINKKQYLEDAWASVEISSGLFEPNYDAQGSGFNAQEFNSFSVNQLSDARNERLDVQNNEDMTAGTSYVVGLNYGARISDKFILQSGLQYGIFESSSVTNTVFETSSTSEFALTKQSLSSRSFNEALQDGNVQIRYENVELRNTFTLASVPLKAGYVIMNKKVNVILNGGVLANVYLGNELTDPDNNLETVQIRPGENSPYRTVNFSATTGMTLGYSFLDNYALTIVPSYQRSINSLTKETSNFRASPEGFGIAVGVRYVFN